MPGRQSSVERTTRATRRELSSGSTSPTLLSVHHHSTPPPRSMRALRPATFSSDRPGSAELRALLLRDADRIFALLTAQVPEAHVATGGTEVRAQSSGALRLFSSSQALWKRMFLPRRGTRSALLSLSRWMLQGIPFIEHGGKLCSSRISSSAAVICFHMHTRISPAFVLLA